MKFGVKIATYRRRNDMTKKLLPRTIDSLLQQTHNDWVAYLVGDRYESDEEFRELVSLLPPDKVVAVNTSGPVERDKYTGKALWMCGGIGSINKIMDRMASDGIRICCTLDDDDIWYEDHLATLEEAYTKFPEAVYVFTQGYHVQMGPLPDYDVQIHYNNLPPIEHRMLHSTASWDMQKIPLRYVNTVETDNPLPGDADLWIRMRGFMHDNGLKCLYVPKLTVWHDEHNPDKNQGCVLAPHSEFLA